MPKEDSFNAQWHEQKLQKVQAEQQAFLLSTSSMASIADDILIFSVQLDVHIKSSIDFPLATAPLQK